MTNQKKSGTTAGVNVLSDTEIINALHAMSEHSTDEDVCVLRIAAERISGNDVLSTTMSLQHSMVYWLKRLMFGFIGLLGFTLILFVSLFDVYPDIVPALIKTLFIFFAMSLLCLLSWVCVGTDKIAISGKR